MFSRPGQARGCFTNTVIHSINSFDKVTLGPPTALWRRQAQMVWNGASNLTINYVTQI